jgi:hypothetical protein
MFHRKCPAGIGAVRIDRAAIFADKWAGSLGIVSHTQQHFREIKPFSQDNIHISIQKAIRIHFQALLQAQDIIWIQEKVQVAATPVEAGHTGVTFKTEGFAGFNLFPGQGRQTIDLKDFHDGFT